MAALKPSRARGTVGVFSRGRWRPVPWDHSAGRSARWDSLRLLARQLRTRLLLVVVGLLAAACTALSLLGQAALDMTLTRQLDEELYRTNQRVQEVGVQGVTDLELDGEEGPPGGRAPLAGNVTVQVVRGEVRGGRVFDADGEEQPVPEEDAERIEEIVRRLGNDHGGRTGEELGPVDTALSSGGYRLLALDDPYHLGSVLVGVPLDEKQETMRAFGVASGLLSTLAVVGSGILGWILVRRSLRPLEQVSAAAADVARLPLASGEVSLADQRVPAELAEPGTEVGEVGFALNSLIDNVDSALAARQRSESRLREFVADASHELRTPLTAVRGYTDMLRLTEPLTEAGRASLTRVEQQTLRMTALVEDLLLLARLDQGRPPEMREADLAELVLESLTDASAAGPDHQWSVDLPEEAVPVRADVGQLRQVLANLLSNARKHTPAGTAVTASVRRAADGWAEVSVLDEGPGIPPDFQDKLFERFSRLDTSRQTREGSTGLGLSIVRSVVEAHGGTVGVDSRPGRTVFTVRLPPAG
ncbi:sensor histidine kinase [Kocuria sp. M1R5S2]|uniref:sensor histidine kinase n=1 Tax=Kocuria rhizosphaerae TaxID=3376285 RepID=UPI0037B2AE7B